MQVRIYHYSSRSLTFLLKEKAQEAVENIDSVIPGVGYRFCHLLALEQNSGLSFLVYKMEVA